MSFNDDLKQSEAVNRLIANLSANPKDKNNRDKLMKIAKMEHSSDCALGSVPVCTCGKWEATKFLFLDVQIICGDLRSELIN